jgi:hypothetical protein
MGRGSYQPPADVAIRAAVLCERVEEAGRLLRLSPADFARLAACILPEGFLPSEATGPPCTAGVGSPERIDAMRARAERGEELTQASDATHYGGPAPFKEYHKRREAGRAGRLGDGSGLRVF